MIGWILENIGTIMVSMILLAIVTVIIIKMVNNKRTGKSPCGCDCGKGCSGSCNCHCKV